MFDFTEIFEKLNKTVRLNKKVRLMACWVEPFRLMAQLTNTGFSHLG